MTDQEHIRHFEAIVESKLSELIEHCPGSQPAVQILVSWVSSSGETHHALMGSGNFYARVGMCQELITRDKARTSNDVRAEDEDPGDDSEVPS